MFDASTSVHPRVAGGYGRGGVKVRPVPARPVVRRDRVPVPVPKFDASRWSSGEREQPCVLSHHIGSAYILTKDGGEGEARPPVLAGKAYIRGFREVPVEGATGIRSWARETVDPRGRVGRFRAGRRLHVRATELGPWGSPGGVGRGGFHGFSETTAPLDRSCCLHIGASPRGP